RKAIFIVLLSCLAKISLAQKPVIKVGAKHFNEGYILAELIAQLLENNGFAVERKFNLGGTTVTFEALRTGEIDVYPEYSGTISEEILHLNNENEIKGTLAAKYNLEVSNTYGFSNSYALLVSEELSKKLNLHCISDLEKYPELRMGFSNEFMKRTDGWENLKTFYKLPHQATGLEHGLAYTAILEGSIDVTDAYTTDGEIAKYKLVVLDDDDHFFPDYFALSFYSQKLDGRAKEVLKKLEGHITAQAMQQMNAAALPGKKTHAEVANEFLVKEGLLNKTGTNYGYGLSDILWQVFVHIKLTLLSLGMAVGVGLPLGIWLRNYALLSKVVVYVTGILQTIPSIALLALMIPLLGIGTVPAIAALFLYALLPVLRGTITGLRTVDPQLKKVATAIGLNSRQKLWMVEMPLAIPVVLTGIRTAAVISVGTATLAAFIGAGGLGEFIVTGLALNNTTLILMGAIPAAVLAVLIELFFEWVEILVVPCHLRGRDSR
ncbi:MAG TPA: glycine betaine ABC transporter substrate-binding protein, partial [Flavobacteriales bacterium]|nr:glycine betaine ABC transporter substrate-binding protein [Flavobacteriales bacterium]